jgi:hypothetical protein
MVRVLPVLVLMLWSAAPADAQETKRTTAEQIITLLQEQRLSYEKDLKTTPFQEVLDDLEKRHKVRFIISKGMFGEDFASMQAMKAESLNVKDLEGMYFHTFLKAYLAALPLDGVTYVVRPDHIEITTKTAAAQEVGLQEEMKEAAASSDTAAQARAYARLQLPLVCVAAKEKPLSGVLDDLRRIYGANIVVETSAKPQLKTMITEQLLNVPVDTALQLLAGQADLAVVRKGNTFRIISNAKG